MDIASLGFAIDSSQAGQAAGTLDRMVQSANTAQQAQQRLTASGASLEAQMRQMVAVQKEQQNLIGKLVTEHGKLEEKLKASSKGFGDMTKASESASKGMLGLATSMGTFTKSADLAWKSAEKLDDAFDSIWKTLDLGGSKIAAITAGMEDLQRVTGVTNEQILSANRAIDQLKLGAEGSTAVFTRVTQILSDTSDATRGLRDRIESYIGTMKNLSAGEVVAKLTTALNQTRDSAQKTADAMTLLGVQGAEGLRKISEAGEQVYTDGMKRLDQLENELLRRQQKADAQARKDKLNPTTDYRGAIGRTLDFFDPFDINPLVPMVTEFNRLADTHLIKPMEKFFTLSDEARIKVALINEEAMGIWESSQGFFGSLIGYFDSIYSKYSNLLKLALGTYQVSIAAGDDLGQFSTFNDALKGGALQKTVTLSPQDAQAGRQFMSQFDPATAAVTKFNETQKAANELFAKGAIGADELGKAVFEAGQQYTRATGKVSPFTEALAKQRSEEAALIEKGAADRRLAIEAQQKDIEALRTKQQEWADLLAGVLPGGTRSMVRRREGEAAVQILTAEDKVRVSEDIAWIEEMTALAVRQVNDWVTKIESGRISEVVEKQTEAFRLQVAEISRISKALDQYGVAGDDVAKRTSTIFDQIKKEAGDTAAAAFLDDKNAIPDSLKLWVQALDEVTEANKRLQAQRAAMNEERELGKVNALLEAQKKGPAALAENERAMKLLAVANGLGYDSFAKLAEAFPLFAGKLQLATDAASSARIVIEGLKNAADAAKAVMAATDVANLGVMAPAMVERARIQQDIDRKTRERISEMGGGAGAFQDRMALVNAAEAEKRDRLALLDANTNIKINDNSFQNQLKADIARANAAVATAGPNAQTAVAGRIDFVSSDLINSVRTEQDLAKARRVLAGDTRELTAAEKERLAGYSKPGEINRTAEVAKYAQGLNLATEAAQRLADAEGKGAAAMRAAQAENRVAQAGTQDVGGLAAAAEREQELIAINQLVAQYNGQVTQATELSVKFAEAIAAGATSSQEFQVVQEKHNATLAIGVQIKGDDAEMERKREEAIRAATAAIDARILAEGKNQGAQQLAASQQQLDQLKAYNTALGEGGTALADHLDKVEKNNLALGLFKTTYEKLPEDAQKLVDQLRQVNAELEAQRKVTAAINALQSDRDGLAYLEKEVELIGKGRREREITLQTMRLEQQLEKESLGLKGDQLEELRKIYAQRAELIPQTVDKGLVKEDMEREAQLWQDIWKNATLGIQNSFAGFFESILSGGTKTWGDLADSLKRIMFQVIAQIAAAMVFRPVIGSVLGSLGASSDFMRSVGLGSYAAGGANAPSSGLASVIGDIGGVGRQIFGLGAGPSGSGGLIQGVMDTPLWGATGSSGSVLSGSYQAASNAFWDVGGSAVGSAATTGGMTIGQAMPAVGAGLSIYNAVQNPNIGTIAGAGLSTVGAAASMFPAMFGSLAALGPYGMIAGAVLSILGNTLFKQKPSNLGAETSFSMDQLEAGAALDFSNLFRGDKHPNSLKSTDSLSTALQDTMSDLADQFKDVRFGGTFGANYGRKEGTSIFYGAPDITDVSQRTTIKFDPEDEAAAAQAFLDVTLAALKGADFSKLGETVSAAMANTTATTLDQFLADLDFAKKFETTVDFLNKGWDPVNSQLAQIKSNAEASGDAVAKTISDFLEKTEELWPSVTRSFNAAGEEILSTTETVMSNLVVEYGQANTEAEAAGASLRDAAGNYYSFTGQIGDATLDLTNASGEVTTATYNAATGLYELATTITTLSDTVVTEITEMSTQGQQGSLAAKNFALGVAGVNDVFRFVLEDGIAVLKQGAFEVVPALTGLELALAQAHAGVEGLRPAFEAAGISAEQIAQIFVVAFAQAEQQVRDAFAQMKVASDFYWTSQFNPAAIPTVGQVFASVQADQNATPNFRDELNAFLLRAGSGVATQADYEGLTDNFQWQASHKLLTGQQLSGIKSMIDAAFRANLTVQQGILNPGGGSSGIDSGGGGGGGGGGGVDTSEQQKAIREQITALNENASEARNLANSFGRMSVQLLDYRKSLLLGNLTPLTPKEQLDEARRQFEDALARSNSGDKEVALKGMQDLQGASSQLLEKSRSYYASSTAYQEDFDKVQQALLTVGNKAKTIEEQQLTVLTGIESQLVDLNEQIGALQQSSSNGGGGTVTTPGGGTTPSTNYPSNQFPYAQNGVLFGVAGMGRGATEKTEDFMKRRFSTSVYSGPYDETSAYEWMQGTHGSGATRNQYYTAATKAGYTGQFGGSGHTDFLNADKTGQEWVDFILNLRQYTTVIPGAYASSMAAGMPEWVYQFNQGGMTVGGNVLPFTRPDRGGRIATAPTLLGLMGGRMGLAGEHRDEAILPLARTASGDMGVQVSGGGSDGATAGEIRRMIQQNGAAYSEMISLLRVVERRIDDLGNTIRRAA